MSQVRVYPRVLHGFSHGYGYGYEIADPAKTRTRYGNSNCGATKYGSASRALHLCFLTFTTIAPDRFRRKEPYKFWEIADGIVQDVMDTNYVAADQMARRVAPRMVEQGWGRIVNVTTKLDTMNRPHTSPYGSHRNQWEPNRIVGARP